MKGKRDVRAGEGERFSSHRGKRNMVGRDPDDEG